MLSDDYSNGEVPQAKRSGECIPPFPHFILSFHNVSLQFLIAAQQVGPSAMAD